MGPLLDHKLRLLCSYGGRIMPLPPSKSLHYVGGETRLVQVPRGLSFNAFFDVLSLKLLSGRSFSLKYKLPGCDLDSLITVSDKDDLQNMIYEYDLARFRRIRLFLFPKPIQRSMSVNRLLGLSFNSSSPSNSNQCIDLVDTFAEEDKKPNNECPTATAEEDKKQNNKCPASEEDEKQNKECPKAAAEENTVSDKETEKEEVQDQPKPSVKESLPPSNQYILCYVPVLAMQSQTLNHLMAPGLDPATGDSEKGT